MSTSNPSVLQHPQGEENHSTCKPQYSASLENFLKPCVHSTNNYELDKQPGCDNNGVFRPKNISPNKGGMTCIMGSTSLTWFSRRNISECSMLRLGMYLTLSWCSPAMKMNFYFR